MKTLTFNKDSLHYKLASITTNQTINPDQDICSYTKSVSDGLFVVSIIGVVFSMLSFLVVHMILGTIFALIYGAWILSEAAIIGYIFLSMVVVIFGIDWFVRGAVLARERAANSVKPDGFIKHAYKSWKDRYCIKIKFVSKDHDDNLRAGQ